MAKIYANKVMLRERELSDVPEKFYESVVVILKEKGYLDA